MNTHAEITISVKEAVSGTKRVITRNRKRLEVTVPFGVRSGTIIRLRDARIITDGCYGDLLVQINVKKPFNVGIAVTAVVVIVLAFFAFLMIQMVNGIDDTSDLQATGIAEDPAEPVVEIPETRSLADIAASEYITVFDDIQPPSEFILGDPIKLRNNRLATNPTWQELYDFLIADMTDSKYYKPGIYECGHFAEDVHNNAEAAGIRTAWVGVWFVDELVGHAINAFYTIDHGLIYIDCQGLDLTERLAADLLDTNLDYVAYIVEGKALGEIHIDDVESFDYSFYEDYERLLIIWARLMGEELFEESLQIVETVEIYW